MPVVAPMPVAITPTKSESLAPKRMRERMQRPNSSVPSGNSADGPARAYGRSWRMGSCGAIRRAPNARTTSPRMTASPITASRCFAKRRQISFIADARVEPAVEEIHQQIDEDENDGDQQHASLHHRIVALEDGRYREAAHAGPRKYGLGDHGAAEKEPVLQTDHGYHRDERIREGVLADHAGRRHALGARRGDIFPAEDIEHPRAREPADDGDRRRGQRGGREQNMTQAFPVPHRPRPP